jgi:predicted nucleotidyltransferase
MNAVDAEAPGLLEGLYLTGSAALGDFRPHTNDIDFVAVTATRSCEAAIPTLERVHRQLRRRWHRPFFDGSYVDVERSRARPRAYPARAVQPRGPISRQQQWLRR